MEGKPNFGGEGFSSTRDVSGDSYSFNDLDQLSANSKILDVSKDTNSDLEKLVLKDGAFEFSSQSYINDSVRDILVHHTDTLSNQQFPITVSRCGQFNAIIDLKNEYFLFPSSLEITVELQLYVSTNGVRRAIAPTDLVCPLDALNPIRNVRACFDSFCTVSGNKHCDQRSFARVMQLITQTTDRQAVSRRIKYARCYFEGESTADNNDSKSHSHKWNESTVELYDLANLPSDASKQNSYLCHAIKDEFLVHVDLSQVPPFNSAKIYSRPLSTIELNLDFGVFNDWLRIIVPDGVMPTGYSPPTDRLTSNFSNLEMDVKQVHVNYNQFALNKILLDYYINKTVSNQWSNINQQSVEMHQVAAPVKKDSTNWSAILYNLIVPDRLFLVFRTLKNRNDSGGNPNFYSNLGVTELSFNMLNTVQNRFNQNRTTSYSRKGDDVVCTTSESYDALNVNKKYLADLYATDMLIRPALLAAGESEAGKNRKKTFLLNEESIYRGDCVYVVNTGIQIRTSKYLKEHTVRGNIELNFKFVRPLPTDYFCTIWCSYSGEFIVSIVLLVFWTVFEENLNFEKRISKGQN